MSEKPKSKVSLDSVVLGVCGEALLVLGLVLALAGKPQWDSILTLALAATGLFLAIWGGALWKKRQAGGDGNISIVLLVMGILSFVIGIFGYLKLTSLFVLGISAAMIGVASDIVLAIIAKKGKNNA